MHRKLFSSFLIFWRREFSEKFAKFFGKITFWGEEDLGGQCVVEEANPVLDENVFGVGVGVAASAEEGGEGLQFFNGVQIGGALFGSKASV